jgi:flavin reductase (DIM6/NTAB) family NADH-FMN oxidoreductase RutF
MERKNISPIDLVVRINELWDKQWFLLTCGDYEKNDFNTMTVAWGFLGIMWNKPVAVCVVRPSRYTYIFMEKFNTFTLSAFDQNFKEDLTHLGTTSGRDSNKLAFTDLTIVSSVLVPSPTFEEAELSIECKKIYYDDFNPNNFLDKSIHNEYPLKDYHRIYYGEIVNIEGIERFTR